MFVARGAAHRGLVNAQRGKDYKDLTPRSDNFVRERGEEEQPLNLDESKGATTRRTAINTNEAANDSNQSNKAPDVVDVVKPEHVGKASPHEGDEDDALRFWLLDDFTGNRLLYMRLSNLSITAFRHSWFNSLVMLCISWASLSVGLQTYEALSTNEILDDLDLAVLSVFILECVLKIMAEGLTPWRFFTGKEMRWNCFDFGIIIMSLPMWGSALGGGNITILRMLRLMRIMKLVKRIPQLYMIVMGLIGGLKSIGYILLLLFLVFYLYAISGMYAWKDNDMFHFRSVPIAMVTLFRMSTLENWSNIMNINYFGCDRFQGGCYTNDPNDADRFHDVLLHHVHLDLGFRHALSLFIGAITMSMTQSMEHMKAAQEEAERKKRIEKAQKRALEAQQREKEMAEKRRLEAAAAQANREAGAEQSEKGLSAAEKRDRRKMREVLLATWDDCDLTDILTQKEGDNKSLRGRYLQLANLTSKIVEHPKFANFVTLVIIMAGVLVGLQTSPEVEDAIGTFLTGLDSAILAVFTTEVILKLIAEGLEPWGYFRSAWNTFDFVIVVGSFTKGKGGMLTTLRLLRLLRVLKLVRAFPQLQVIVSALMKGVSSIGYIGLILLLCFYVFGILGNMMFAQNDPFHFQ
ncbi:Voltage-gated ion channel, partial [Globisporangium splendens]